MIKLKIVVLITLVSMLPAISHGDTVRKGEFPSIQQCLSAIKRNTNQNLQIITDKPTLVSGFLQDGRHFGCKRIESGSKGTYVEGWFTER